MRPLSNTFYWRSTLTVFRSPIVETYFQRSDLAHCLIIWFLSLAFLDDAFDKYRTPQELFSLRNSAPYEIELKFKKERLKTPICRRMEALGKQDLSSYLPWSSTSVIEEGKRIFADAGFPQRWTPHCIRRVIGNRCEESMLHTS